MKLIEMSHDDILKVAMIAEQHGSDVIETYLFGDREKGERVWVWDSTSNTWKDLYIYPWYLDHPNWGEFYIGANPND